MGWLNGPLRPVGTLVVVAALLFCPVTAESAFTPRSPQVPVQGEGLQDYLNNVGEAIDVTADQVDGQVWEASLGTVSSTLIIEIVAGAAGNAIGIYNAGGPPGPPLFQVFPPAATVGWFATAHFSGGNLIVTLFDVEAVIQAQKAYAGVTARSFGFYIQAPGGTFYSQDAHNGDVAQVLTYPGTGNNSMIWWECFEDAPPASSDRDFDDAVLTLQNPIEEGPPTAVGGSTWGKIKSLYRR